MQSVPQSVAQSVAELIAPSIPGVLIGVNMRFDTGAFHVGGRPLGRGEAGASVAWLTNQHLRLPRPYALSA
ncbi:MAG: hypothetical protein U0350_18075 [Caldilineaceae bacterium]